MRNSKKSIKKSLIRSSTRVYPVIAKDIVINFQNFVQVFEDYNIGDCVNDSKQLSLKKLSKKLQRQCNIFFKDKSIKFYLEDGDIWMRCPRINYFIEQQDYLSCKQLKFELKVDMDLISVVMNQNQISDQEEQEDNDEEDGENQGKCRRLKQRKIKNVIQKVLKWRQLYAGIRNGVQVQEKIPLDEGAQIVKISKKTLDDYLAQLKKGRKYGFNFNEHKNDKVGVLRQFIRKAERKNQK